MLIRWIVCLGALACACLQSSAQGVQGRGSSAVPDAASANTSAVASANTPAATSANTATGATAVAGTLAAETADGGRAASVSPDEAIAQALDGILKGYRFNKRLLAQNPQDHWLLFTRADHETVLVGWTERGGTDDQRLALAPASPMAFGLYRYDGSLIRSVDTIGYEIGMVLEREPKILIPTAPNGYLMLAANAQTMPQVIRVSGPQTLELTCEFYNPLDEIAIMPVPDMGRTIAVKPGGMMTVRKEVSVGRSSEPIYTSIGAMGIRQPVTIVVENPLELIVRPEEPQVLSLDIVNIGGAEINGEVLLRLSDASEPFRMPLQFRSGQRLNTVRIPLNSPLPLPSTLSVAVEQTLAQPLRTVYQLGQTGALQFVPTANFSNAGRDGTLRDYREETSGGASAVIRGGVPANTPLPWPEYGALGLVYDLGPVAAGAADTARIDIVPTTGQTAQVIGVPGKIGFWLQGDGSGNLLSLVWSDAAGNEYVSEERAVDWRGWRYVMFKTPWGEAAVDTPLRWSALMRLRGDPRAVEQTRRGALLANGFCFTYGDNFSRSGYTDPALSQYEQSVTMPAAPAVVSEPEVKLGKPVQRTGRGGSGGSGR